MKKSKKGMEMVLEEQKRVSNYSDFDLEARTIDGKKATLKYTSFFWGCEIRNGYVPVVEGRISWRNRVFYVGGRKVKFARKQYVNWPWNNTLSILVKEGF